MLQDWTSFLLAAQGGSHELVHLLLSHGAAAKLDVSMLSCTSFSCTIWSSICIYWSAAAHCLLRQCHDGVEGQRRLHLLLLYILHSATKQLVPAIGRAASHGQKFSMPNNPQGFVWREHTSIWCAALRILTDNV